jgi:signal peptide peptidase SppA
MFPNHLPSLISPLHFQQFVSRLAARDLITRGSIHRIDDGDDGEDKPWWKIEDLWGDPLPAPELVGSTAVIPIKGVITSGQPTIFRAIHFADTEEIADWITQAAGDNDVKRILLSVDSPGGMYQGTPELADIVSAASAVKPVVAHTSGMMDSAAYWIASQAQAVYCTPSADVGCIGVYQVHYDFTAMLKDFGVAASMFKSGDLKATGHPHVAMSDAQRADVQKTIDFIGEEFRTAIKSKRSLVEDDSMRGQSFIGRDAMARNLVGGLRSLDSLL